MMHFQLHHGGIEQRGSALKIQNLSSAFGEDLDLDGIEDIAGIREEDLTPSQLK